MARYDVRYLTYAAEQLRQLPRSVRTTFDTSVDDLRRDPYLIGVYDKREGCYSTTFDGMGLIFYVVGDEIAMVTITRLFWLK
ncbi:MAG: hypothetical protein M3Y48_25190 [Actinomycetota bacterium]|nr:hypothetical protein [Actinomycetota bacterium]